MGFKWAKSEQGMSFKWANETSEELKVEIRVIKRRDIYEGGLKRGAN